LVINFEPDIRSNALAWLTGAPTRVGYWTGGGRSFLTEALAYDPSTHVRTNARALVARAAALTGRTCDSNGPEHSFRLNPPEAASRRAASLLEGARRPLIGLHASGGRASKQWHLDRFAQAGFEIAQSTNGTLVLTGAAHDRSIVDEVRSRLGAVPFVDVCGLVDLPTLAAVIGKCDLFITGDTGPMHLAAAMDTPTVALFGPSNPVRYGPVSRRARVLRVSLPCSPCGLVREPPSRCRGHVPDCLDGISVSAVVEAARDLLSAAADLHPVQ
jgi:ADP-heptose:LPS heptosyltransferase